LPTLDDVYRKFGEVAEAAQLLETEVGNFLLIARGDEQNLFTAPSPSEAADILKQIERSTLGALLKQVSPLDEFKRIEELLAGALAERNRLSHTFYRQHNFRRNSDEGRALMLADLEEVHVRILDAFVAVHKVNGIDLSAMAEAPLPTKHVPI